MRKGWREGKKEDSQVMLKMNSEESAEPSACHQIMRGVKATGTDMDVIHLKACRLCVWEADSGSGPCSCPGPLTRQSRIGLCSSQARAGYAAVTNDTKSKKFRKAKADFLFTQYVHRRSARTSAGRSAMLSNMQRKARDPSLLANFRSPFPVPGPQSAHSPT